MRRLLTLIPVVLVLAACGGDDDGAVEASASTTTSAASEAETSTTAAADAAALTAIGESYGRCLGYCEVSVAIDDGVLTLIAVDRELPAPATNTGRLTGEGLTQVQEVGANVDPSSLEERYGCPDCADGGSSTVTFGDVTSTYERGNPPPELADVDAVADPILEALSTCEPNDVVLVDEGCTPL